MNPGVTFCLSRMASIDGAEPQFLGQGGAVSGRLTLETLFWLVANDRDTRTAAHRLDLLM